MGVVAGLGYKKSAPRLPSKDALHEQPSPKELPADTIHPPLKIVNSTDEVKFLAQMR
jgi:hypothetical protein